jgi:hypothetical protein
MNFKASYTSHCTALHLLCPQYCPMSSEVLTYCFCPVQVIQLQGDQRKNVHDFLLKVGG